MTEVAKLPGTCTLCEQRAPIVADVGAQVSFRALAGEAFMFKMSLCEDCCEVLGLTEDAARKAMQADAYPGSEPVAQMPKCKCGRDAQLMTSKGYRCRKCI